MISTQLVKSRHLINKHFDHILVSFSIFLHTGHHTTWKKFMSPLHLVKPSIFFMIVTYLTEFLEGQMTMI